MRWDRGPYLPDQAVLIDFPSRRFYFFFIEIWPQEFYYITGLLVLAALALFLVTSIAGRVWCGYTCPQTVWTDLMIAVERFFQGDRNARMRLDKAPWSFETLWRKAATHADLAADRDRHRRRLGLLFRRRADARPPACHASTRRWSPMSSSASSPPPPMCWAASPASRSASICAPGRASRARMFDRDSLLISYRAWRGEPRGPHKAGQSWEGRGDCIDCRQCVAVCPTGIDIRDGSQLECIQCALCIDACNEIMDKVGRPRGLIAYDTVRNLEAPGPETVPISLAAAARDPLRHRHGDCRRDHADGLDASARSRGQRAARPQPALCQALRRRLAQRLHHQASQQALRAALLQPRRRRACRERRSASSATSSRADPGRHRSAPTSSNRSGSMSRSTRAPLRRFPAQSTEFSFVVTDVADGTTSAEHGATFQGPER